MWIVWKRAEEKNEINSLTELYFDWMVSKPMDIRILETDDEWWRTKLVFIVIGLLNTMFSIYMNKILAQKEWKKASLSFKFGSPAVF